MNGLLLPTRSVSDRTASTRDRAANALVLGLAGALWFSWAQADPPSGWASPLSVGGVVGVLLAVAAAAMTWRRRRLVSAMAEHGARQTYRGVVVGEVVSIALGAVLLSLTGAPAYIAAWILFVVGVHFVPLGRLFRLRDLEVLGVSLAAVAAVAAGAALVGAAPTSAVAGAGGGALMVLFGAWSLWRSAVERADSSNPQAV